ECESLEHYYRWLEAEGMAPVSTDPLETGPLAPDAIPATTEPQTTIRGQSPAEAQPQAQWWVRPAVAQQPTGHAYQTVNGQSPDVMPNSAYATLPNSQISPYGGSAVGATDPASKPASNVQQVQYTESI